MTKNSFKQTNSLTLRLLRDTHREMFLYPSQAEDSDTIKRNAQYFITKMGNKTEGISEYSDTMIMLSLMGVRSFYSTHAFQWCNIWSAVKHQRTLHANHGDSSGELSTDTETESTDSDANDGVLHMIDTGHENQPLDLEKICNSPPQLTFKVLRTVVTTTTNRTKKRTIVVAAQFEDYRFRGEALKEFSFYNYIANVKRVHKPRTPRDTSKAGQRAFNLRIQYMKQHPLSDTHEHQCARSSYLQTKSQHRICP